ncbi:MAG TPA: addiction module protein [Thermoanaerobaculia bacterium]|nr:addiction module protein [Thermoanaerobaculia bacterium]
MIPKVQEGAELDRLWAEEAEARYADLLAGKTAATDGDEGHPGKFVTKATHTSTGNRRRLRRPHDHAKW